MQRFELIRFASPDELARAAAEAWVAEIEQSANAGKPHRVALSGGRIAQKFFSAVIEQSKKRRTSFDRVDFFWADERCVPPTDPESNFYIARQFLFEPLNILERQIHRVRGEESPEDAARLASEEVSRVVGAESQPVFDLIFLGLGEDGHVASLFPGALQDDREGIIYHTVLNSPKPPARRVTLSYRAILAATQVWVIASGPGKETALRDSLSPVGITPLARVIARRQSTKIYLDIPI